MSDPFMPLEARHRVTRDALRVLSDYGYPAVVSTKSRLLVEDDYRSVLMGGRFVIQFSMVSLDDRLLQLVDVGTPGPHAILDAARELVAAGIPTTCRLQPLLPGREDDAFSVIEACAEAGVHHVAAEHLKIPVEQDRGIDRLSSILRVDLRDLYRQKHSIRVGREWVLPTEERLDRVLALRSVAHENGLTFGAADTDLLLLSDGSACCSGVDLISRHFGTTYHYNYSEACRRGVQAGVIELSLLRDVWRPDGSISRFVNSSSRIPASTKGGAGVEAYIKRNWNGSPNGVSPRSFYGIRATDERDEDGYVVYEATDELRRLMSSRVSQASKRGQRSSAAP